MRCRRSFWAARYLPGLTNNAGTLRLSASGSIASSSAIAVASGATFDVSAVSGYSLGASQVLSGSGSVLGNVTALGTIAPGTSPGTLTFENNLSLGSGSILDYELSGTDMTVGRESTTFPRSWAISCSPARST